MYTSSTIRARAPGSIMLLGEHAVLRGATAIACAVDRYISVSLEPIAGSRVRVESALGHWEVDLHALPPQAVPEQAFVLAALRRWQARLPSGFRLRIEAEFAHTLGLGSSAAVVAALAVVLDRFSGIERSAEALFAEGLAVIHEVQQGRGSGTDLAASLHGGLIAYRVAPRRLEPLPGLPPLGLWYVGYKMKTPEVLALVEGKAARYPELHAGLDRLMAECTEQAVAAIRAQQWSALGELMNFYQGLMDALGVCDRQLAALVYRLREGEGVLGSKISGSGLGDCVVTLGEDPRLQAPGEAIPVAVAPVGALGESP